MITALETRYLGYKFRSRLEARWAVVFTSLGVQWVYEPEGLVLPRVGPYLPDFLLTRHNVYIEIKPTLPNSEERAKLKALAQVSGNSCFFLVGQPGEQTTISATEPTTEHSLNLCGCGELLFLRAQSPYRRSAVCPGCGETKLFPWPGFLRAGLSRAFSAARSARFGEHGEAPGIP